MPEARKRPCAICRQWFRPDARVGSRQHACGKPECQTSRRQKTQASWRRRNPGYAIAYRIDQRAYSERWRSPFRRDADHFSAVLGMVIGIVGIVLLSRLHEARWANWRQTGLHWKGEGRKSPKERWTCRRCRNRGVEG